MGVIDHPVAIEGPSLWGSGQIVTNFVGVKFHAVQRLDIRNPAESIFEALSGSSNRSTM